MGKIILFPITIVAEKRVAAGVCVIGMNEIRQSIELKPIMIPTGA